MEWIYAITALLNVLAAIFAWITSRRWKNDYLANCNEAIHIREQQIESLKHEVEVLNNLVPTRIREYFLTVKLRLEIHMRRLKNELEEITSALQDISVNLSAIRAKERSDIEEIKEFEEAERQLQCKVSTLEDELAHMSQYLEVTRFVISDSFHETIKNPIIDEMVGWFFDNYESTANSVPYNASKGGYQYVYGGPYNVLKALSSHFSDSSVHDVLLAVEVVEKQGTEWVRKGQY